MGQRVCRAERHDQYCDVVSLTESSCRRSININTISIVICFVTIIIIIIIIDITIDIIESRFVTIVIINFLVKSDFGFDVNKKSIIEKT